jgi:genome maintenance exonuclease 1
MKLIEKIDYIKLERVDGGPDGRKYVTPDGISVSSVTNILDATKSEESKQALENWRKFKGDKKADEITKEAGVRGTIMHSYLEKHIRGDSPKAGTNFYHKQAYKMASVIMDNYLKPFLDEAWGLEVNMFYPGLYAGTTDMVGVFQGKPSIIDFKQTNKPKSDDRVIDYKNQLVAYACAHNHVYGTNIRQGVILMCSKDFEPQKWILSGDEFDEYEEYWWKKVAKYYGV